MERSTSLESDDEDADDTQQELSLSSRLISIFTFA